MNKTRFTTKVTKHTKKGKNQGISQVVLSLIPSPILVNWVTLVVQTTFAFEYGHDFFTKESRQ